MQPVNANMGTTIRKRQRQKTCYLRVLRRRFLSMGRESCIEELDPAIALSSLPQTEQSDKLDDEPSPASTDSSKSLANSDRSRFICFHSADRNTSR